jgi:cell division protein FtsB
MTARRGSLRFKVARFAGRPFRDRKRTAGIAQRLGRVARAAMRIVVAADVLFVAGAFGTQMWRVGEQSYHLRQQIDGVERRNVALAQDSAQLRRRIDLLHDPDFLVPLIHEQLGLVKPHEVFFEVGPPKPTPGD